MIKKEQHKIPWTTIFISLIIIGVSFIFLFYSETVDPRKLYSEIGAPYAIQIYQGQYWGVLTNSFIHIDYIHLGINLIGFIIFSTLVERKIGATKTFLLIIIASIITSSTQLTLTDDAGLGFDGINFLLFSYLLTRSLLKSEFKFPYRFVFLLGATLIIIVSYYINTTEDKNYGVEAMLTGLIAGLIFGLISKSKIAISLFSVILIIGCYSSLISAPWSSEWNYSQGYKYHDANNFHQAKKYYNEALKIDPNHSVSRENLRIILIEELSDIALLAHENEDYIKAREYYEKIIKIDSNNSWAIENMDKLP